MIIDLLALSSSNIVDIAILVLLALFMIVGLTRGFIKTVFKFVGKIVSLILAFILCAKFVGFMDQKFNIISTFSATIEKWLPGAFGETLMNTSLADIQANESIVTGAKGLSGIVVKLVLSIVADSEGIDTTITLSQVLAPTFSYYICLVLGFIVLYIILRILFFMIDKLMSGIFSKLKVLGMIDKILGGILGLVEGFFLTYILIFIIGIIPFGFATTATTAINTSKIGAFIVSIDISALVSKAINSFDFIKNYLTGKFPA